jgi:hypothetical protein
MRVMLPPGNIRSSRFWVVKQCALAGTASASSDSSPTLLARAVWRREAVRWHPGLLAQGGAAGGHQCLLQGRPVQRAARRRWRLRAGAVRRDQEGAKRKGGKKGGNKDSKRTGYSWVLLQGRGAQGSRSVSARQIEPAACHGWSPLSPAAVVQLPQGRWALALLSCPSQGRAVDAALAVRFVIMRGPDPYPRSATASKLNFALVPVLLAAADHQPQRHPLRFRVSSRASCCCGPVARRPPAAFDTCGGALGRCALQRRGAGPMSRSLYGSP